MKILSRDSTKENGWGHNEEPEHAPCKIYSFYPNMHHSTLILQCPTKLLKTTYASLFDLPPPDILVYIDIWLSVLKHHDKSKPFILRFKYMSNPVLLAISQKYWTPYHDIKAFQWYNIVR